MNGLSPEQLRDLEEARHRAKKIRTAISIAKFDGWTIAIFGGLTLLSAAFGSLWALVLGVGMCTIAYVELTGAQRLRRLDPTAAKTLAINQICLGLLLLSYAVYSLCTATSGIEKLMGTESSPEVAQMLGDVKGLAQMLSYLIYGTLAAVAIFGQGGTALFYLSRRKYVEAYLRQTPTWIIEAQRAGMPM